MSAAPLADSVTVVGASTAGCHHTLSGAPCQDASAWGSFPGRGWAFAVADGAGSSPRSAEGAQLAVELVIKILEDVLAEPGGAGPLDTAAAIELAVEASQGAIRAMAREQGEPEGHFSTTLQVAVAFPEYVTFAQLGDGACVLRRHGSDVYGLVFVPHEGEYAGETCFLPRHPSDEHPLSLCTVQGSWAAFALLTDGIASVAITHATLVPVSGFFKPIENLLRQRSPEFVTRCLTRDLESGSIAKRVGDDRTLVFAIQNEPAR